jgi:hypothetical protein
MEPKQASGRTKERGFTVNPLSPFTYYRRHKGSALLLLALITLATLALYLMVSVLDSIPTRAHFHYLTRLADTDAPGRGTGCPGQWPVDLAAIVDRY